MEGVAADVGVRCRLDPEVDARPRRGAGTDRGERHVAVVRLDGLDDAAVRPVDEALGLEARLPVAEAEVDEHLERGAVRGPVVRHGAGDVEPRRAPRPAPRRADGERPVVLPHRLGERHGLARRVPRLDRERHPSAVDVRHEAVADEPLDTGLGERGGGGHGRLQSMARRTAGGCLQRAPRGRRRPAADGAVVVRMDARAGQPFTAPASALDPPSVRETSTYSAMTGTE